MSANHYPKFAPDPRQCGHRVWADGVWHYCLLLQHQHPKEEPASKKPHLCDCGLAFGNTTDFQNRESGLGAKTR